MPTCYERLTFDQCNSLLSFAAGMKTSRVWQSVEPSVFLELGRLARKKTRLGTRSAGQTTLMIESDWRVDKPQSIHFGSSFSQGVLDRLLPGLVGLSICALEVDCGTHELRVRLSDGRVLRTFTEWASQPRWTILVHDRTLLPLDPVWKKVDVTPCIRMSRGHPELEYGFDEAHADLAALKQHYRLSPRSS